MALSLWRGFLPLLLLLSAVLIAGRGFSSADGPFLKVALDSGGVLLELELNHSSNWAIKWNHSVTGILVTDYYSYKDGQMLLTDSQTPAFDAGLGHIPGRGRLESDGQGGYWIYDINEAVPDNSYWLRVGSMAVDHRLIYDGISYSLSALAAGKRVRIFITPEQP